MLFCQVFLNVWIFMFNAIGFLTYFMREGRDQVSITLCQGRIPLALTNEHPKRYVTLLFGSAITILLHLSFWLFNILYKRVNRTRYLEYQNYEQRVPRIVNKENIHMYVTNIFALVYLVSVLATGITNNLKHPSDLEKYPHFLTIYFEHCIIPSFSQGLGMAIFFAKNKRARSEVWQAVTAAFEKWDCRWQQ